MLRTGTTTSSPPPPPVPPPPLPRSPPRTWLARGRGTDLRLALDPYRAILSVIMLLTNSRIHSHFPAIARVRPVLVLFVLALTCAVLAPGLVTLKAVFRTWPPQVVAALAILACLSVPFGINFGGAAKYLLTTYASVLLFTFLLFIGIRSARELYTLVWAFVASMGLLVWQSLAVFHLSVVPGTSIERLSQLYSYDSNDAGCVLIVGLVLTLLAFLTAGKKGKAAGAVLLIGIGVALARTGSRGAFVGLIGTGCALLLSLKQVSAVKRMGFVAVVVAGLVLAAPQGYWENVGTVLHPTEDYNWDSPEGRREIWRRGIGYMVDHPVFGLGISNFERAEGTISDKARRRFAATPVRWTAPHNSFIEVGSELGVPGLVVWSSLIVGGIVGMTRLRRRLPEAWLHGDPEERFLYLATIDLPLALVSFAITAFFLSFAYLDIVYVLVAFIAGVYVAVGEKLRRAGVRR